MLTVIYEIFIMQIETQIKTQKTHLNVMLSRRGSNK